MGVKYLCKSKSFFPCCEQIYTGKGDNEVFAKEGLTKFAVNEAAEDCIIVDIIPPVGDK